MSTDEEPSATFIPSCPMPLVDHSVVQLAHGGGGTLMHELIEDVFVGAFDNELLAQRGDATTVRIGDTRQAVTTDSYVVKPLFFPGGDIGSLAVHGTVNDLAMVGARPLHLTAGFIIEEGLEMAVLQRVVTSMAGAAAAAGVGIVAGDTKVVDRGKADGLFINTAGMGIIEHALTIAPESVRPGDVVIVSGDLGRHGIAVMAEREGLAFEGSIESDSASVWPSVAALLKAGVDIHCLRDLTRGGLSSALNEIAGAAGRPNRTDRHAAGVPSAAPVIFELEERAIPIREDVRGACELLGLDPLYVACEGRFVAIVAPADADRALAAISGASGRGPACVIGRVVEGRRPMVTLRSRIGATRVVDMLSGEQLPRIC